jgi:hypothetical protein
MAAQLDRQVSGNEFSGLVGRTRPIAATGSIVLDDSKVPKAEFRFGEQGA